MSIGSPAGLLEGIDASAVLVAHREQAENHAWPRMFAAMSELRLPKTVEADARAARVKIALAADSAPLWARGAVRVARVPTSPALTAALRHAAQDVHLVRGLEGAARALDAEARGQRLADARSGAVRGVRISRVLLLADDGAERFYRDVEALLRHHGDRVVALRLSLDANALGALLFGADAPTRAALVVHKDAVAAVLFALVEP